MPACFRLFPWDVEGDAAAPARLVEAGITRVALAATYHAARVATPRHPRHRLVEIPASAAYLDNVRGLPRGAWSYLTAREALERAGISVESWIVLGHPDGVQPLLPRVMNAFGDSLSHALCLTAPESRRFMLGVAADVLPAAGARIAWIESPGWSGFGHGSLHEKTAGADFTERQSELLGLCVCDRCLAAAGWADDADVARASIRDAFESSEDLAATPIDSLRRMRQEAADLLRSEIDAIAARCDVLLRYDATDVGSDAQPVVYVGCWGDVASARAALAASAHHGSRAAYVSVLEGDARRFASEWVQLAVAGADELHIYHAGLASDRRLAFASEAADAFDAALMRRGVLTSDSR
jgi:hypothetical protein